MTALLWLIRVLVILLIIRLVVTYIRGALGAGRAPATRRGPGGKPERIGGKLVQDPVCGTYIPEERAIKHGRGDHAQYFCSVECRDKWLTGNTPRAASE